MTGTYIELFDDELWEATSSKGAKTGKLIDTIRLKCALSLIFGKSIKVPEQWLVSSPSALIVISEIVDGWNAYQKTANLGHRTPPPIDIVFVEREGAGGTTLASNERLTAAFGERLVSDENGNPRRLKIHPVFDFDCVSEQCLENRSRLVEILRSNFIIDNRGRDEIAELIEREKSVKHFPLSSIEFADKVMTIKEYCDKEWVGSTYSNAVYQQHLADNTLSVLKLSQGYKEQSEERFSKGEIEILKQIEAFSLFEEHRQPNAYHALWDRSKRELDPQGLSFIEGLGRVGVHRGLSRVTGGGPHGAGYTLFKGVGDSIFFERFSNDLLKPLAGDQRSITDTIMADKEVLKKSEWNMIWHSIYKLRNDRSWQKSLDRAKVKLQKYNYNQDVTFNVTQELFLLLTTRLNRLYFKVYRQDEIGLTPVIMKIKSIWPFAAALPAAAGYAVDAAATGSATPFLQQSIEATSLGIGVSVALFALLGATNLPNAGIDQFRGIKASRGLIPNYNLK